MRNKVFPEIRTKSLLLRQFTENDTGKVFYGLSHPEVIKYYGVSYETLESTRVQMDWFRELEESGSGIWWAICSPGNETFYGACGFNNVSHVHKHAEVGFWLLPEFWGKGIIKEAVPLICNYAFESMHLHRIEAQVETENQNSGNVLRKMNFMHEGTKRDCEIKNGKYISLDIYALINQS